MAINLLVSSMGCDLSGKPFVKLSVRWVVSFGTQSDAAKQAIQKEKGQLDFAGLFPLGYRGVDY